jgi:hypothetical protein
MPASRPLVATFAALARMIRRPLVTLWHSLSRIYSEPPGMTATVPQSGGVPDEESAEAGGTRARNA